MHETAPLAPYSQFIHIWASEKSRQDTIRPWSGIASAEITPPTHTQHPLTVIAIASSCSWIEPLIVSTCSNKPVHSQLVSRQPTARTGQEKTLPFFSRQALHGHRTWPLKTQAMTHGTCAFIQRLTENEEY